MIRAGIVFSFADQSWLGGINYYRNLLDAVQRLPQRGIEPVILTGYRTGAKMLKDLPPVAIVKSHALDRYHPLWWARKVLHRLSGFDLGLERLCIRNGIRVLSHSGHLRPGSKVKTLGWIFDFQHKAMPEWFDAKELAKRDRIFAETTRYCQGVIVSSRAAQDDLKAFYPAAFSKSRVLNFTASIGKVANPVPVDVLRAKYGLPERFFHLPNQFWIHKNHRVVIEALALLRAQGRLVHVAVTGNTHDARHPGHFEALTARIKETGIEGEFRVLGIIPYGDMRSVMEHAVAVVNPSLFEGWSSTVEEAKSLGKQIILSSIPVHVEQAPERGSYFPPKDAAALADLLWKVWNAYDAAADQAAMAKAAEALEGRMQAFGRAYQEMVLELAR